VSTIAFDRVTLAIAGRTVLADVTLDIGGGEFVGVLGPNGAGKTTLMRAVLGLLKPTSGRITINGGDVRRGNPAIGYLPQVRTTSPELRLTGRDFIASSIGGERYGLPLLNAERRRALDEALATVGATELAARPLREMSGGERQRLLFAQALIGRPRILLLDEPLISLDPRHQTAVVDLARRLCRDTGITILFSAHDLNQLIGAVDRILYLGNRQATLGTIDDVITAPVLSRLYDAPIEVVRAGGRIFVLSGAQEVESGAHLHEHDDSHGHHGHEHHGHP
jgi:zinc/manganese transport system ATP-binding protein